LRKSSHTPAARKAQLAIFVLDLAKRQARAGPSGFSEKCVNAESDFVFSRSFSERLAGFRAARTG
jgi:hypothetical protein